MTDYIIWQYTWLQSFGRTFEGYKTSRGYEASKLSFQPLVQTNVDFHIHYIVLILVKRCNNVLLGKQCLFMFCFIKSIMCPHAVCNPQNVVTPLRRKRKRQSAMGTSILSTILESTPVDSSNPGMIVDGYYFLTAVYIINFSQR